MRRGITSLHRDTRSPIPIPLLLSLDPVLVHRSKRMMRGGLELITILFHASCQPDDNNHAFHSIFPPISPASLSHSLMTTFVASPSPSPPSPHITIYLSPIIVIVHRPSHYTSNIPLAGPSFSAPRLPCALFVVAVVLSLLPLLVACCREGYSVPWKSCYPLTLSTCIGNWFLFFSVIIPSYWTSHGHPFSKQTIT